MKKTILLLFLIGCVTIGRATSILIPMDDKQSNHLKAYGVAYWVLKQDVSMWWLLNYKGGSFLIPYAQSIEAECRIRNVSYDLIADVQSSAILAEIAVPETNMDAVKLDKAPKMAVYSPKNKLPWDDAVTMVLTYAEIPYFPKARTQRDFRGLAALCRERLERRSPRIYAAAQARAQASPGQSATPRESRRWSARGSARGEEPQRLSAATRRRSGPPQPPPPALA